MGSKTLNILVSENRELLRQTGALIGRLTASGYGRDHATLGCSSIGKHVRHVVDHYDAFLRAGAVINYDHRQRRTAVEQCPHAGQQSLDAAEKHLRAWGLHSTDTMQAVAVSHAPEGSLRDERLEIISTDGRELTFLANHTLHHMAIIGILSRNLGVFPAEFFGIARSTKRFLAEEQETRERNKWSAAG